MSRRVVAVAVAAAVGVTASAITVSAAMSTQRTSYHVSCNGNDDASGRSPKNAWRTFDRAEQAELQPGDRLLLERGCTWNRDRLDITWSGTADKPIVIANYGDRTAPKPLIQNGKNSNVKISGSHLLVRGLRSHFTPRNQTACGQSIATIYGFNFTEGASNVTLSYSESSGATAGVHLSQRSSNNIVTRNHIHDNNVMTSWGVNPAKDLGAWGVLVRSSGNEISYNRLADNRATCRNKGYRLMSNSIELFEATNTYIHHNRSTGDRVFSELGSSSSKIAANNVFEFNIFQSDLDDSRFITTRGHADAFGPVRGTRVLHNTTYQTGARSQGVVCGGKCGTNNLELRNNVLYAEEKALFANGNVTLGPNVVWSSTGDPLVQVQGASSATTAAVESQIIVADPIFQRAENGNFRLRSKSPGIDAADGVRLSDVDMARKPVNGVADIGAYESPY